MVCLSHLSKCVYKEAKYYKNLKLKCSLSSANSFPHKALIVLEQNLVNVGIHASFWLLMF